ncbi:hypothetical protein GOP47_0004146 [Adiantum capillus-veneris]|uniref:Solute carrier family 40 member n=1 Tax=Adiantum capillus-veneris TaxID=13818 RepID=A0A9D4ZMB5_ADICA|nr:hypothetical protein GOP47_0004146 [Adiantum capillus-veneris]
MSSTTALHVMTTTTITHTHAPTNENNTQHAHELLACTTSPPPPFNNTTTTHNNMRHNIVTAAAATLQLHHHHPRQEERAASGDDDTEAQYAPLTLPISHDDEDDESERFDDDDDDNGSLHTLHSRSVSYLYLSYLLCRWGDRMWEFAVGLFMIEIWTRSLFLTSLYGLVETASIVAFGVILGEWVDKFPRLKVIQTSLVLQNVCVFSATLVILMLLVRPWPTSGSGFLLFSCLVGAVNVLGGISALASLATKISLERDWVIIMAAEQPSGHLTRMNAVMRRIDLSCTLLAAVFVGFIMSVVSVIASAIIMATWNIACIGLEYWLLLTVYKRTPRLHEGKASYHLASKTDTNETKAQRFGEHYSQRNKISCEDSSLFVDIKSVQQRLMEFCKHGTTLWHKVWTLSIFEGWKVYLRQENMLAGIAFSLLSVSVLSFGTLMTASLKERGCPAYVLGLARGCAALIGICATLLYPHLHARMQTLKAGMFSITLQWSFLILCVVSIWLKNLHTSIAVLMAGAAAARAGLWMFDLSVTQLMQESVPEIERGVVAGVQNSMQSFFQLVAYVVGMIIPHPQDFGKLILMSFGRAFG